MSNDVSLSRVSLIVCVIVVAAIAVFLVQSSSGLSAVQGAGNVVSGSVDTAPTVMCPKMTDVACEKEFVGRSSPSIFSDPTLAEIIKDALTKCVNDTSCQDSQKIEDEDNKKACNLEGCGFSSRYKVFDPCKVTGCTIMYHGSDCTYTDGVGGTNLNSTPPILGSGTCQPSSASYKEIVCTAKRSVDIDHYKCKPFATNMTTGSDAASN